MLLTIFCLASSLTLHRSEKRIIFKRYLETLALELLLDVGDGNTIFQAKFRHSKKLIFMALRRKLSTSSLMELEDRLKFPKIPEDRLDWRRLRVSFTMPCHLGVLSEMPDPPFMKPVKSTFEEGCQSDAKGCDAFSKDEILHVSAFLNEDQRCKVADDATNQEDRQEMQVVALSIMFQMLI